ncbi:MAG TPA: sulfatase [Candidatus Fermentibacter daniensis]|nr:sulfatase [Candidatus Fermentibacter daniensis]
MAVEVKSTWRSMSAVVLTLLLTLSGCGGYARPNILLVLIDTARSDHLSCYGYGRETTPHLDSLAEAGARFSRAMSGSPWTLPSMATIFTGLPERAHRARLSDGTFFGVDPALPYLPELLARSGYSTAAFFNVIYMSEHFGFHRGFNHFDCQGIEEVTLSRTACATVDAFLSWLDTRDDDAPFFAAVHFFDPHATYDPPAPYDTLFADPGYSGRFDNTWRVMADMFEANSGAVVIDSAGVRNLVDLYDGELAYTDAEIGRLLASLRAGGYDGNMLVIIIGDHGEEFGEHGRFTHGHSLQAELLDVPLILSGPGVPQGMVRNGPAGSIDIAPTILAAAGLEPPAGLPGRDLLLPGEDEERILAASGLGGGEARQACVRRGDSKVIWDSDTDEAVMFDLVSDPGEREPLPPDGELLDSVLVYWATPPEGHPGAVPWSSAVTDQLRDPGYIR